MNGFSVSGQKADQNLQTEIKFEIKTYRLRTSSQELQAAVFILVPPTRSNIPLKVLNLKLFDWHSMC